MPRYPAPIPPDNRSDFDRFLDNVEHYALRITLAFVLLIALGKFLLAELKW